MVYFIRWISCGIKEKLLVERYYNCKLCFQTFKMNRCSENVLDKTEQGAGYTTSEYNYR